MGIGERLRHFRTSILNISQEDMAKSLEIKTAAYGFYEQERSQPSIQVLQRLSDKGCDLHWLITGKSPPASSAAPPDGNMKQCLDIIQKLVEENQHLQKGLDETRAIKIPKKNGTDSSAGR